jgi:uncharacterized protein YjeT (DUF2065 family)
MQKIIGIIALVIGVVLLYEAHDMAEAIGSQVKEAITGAPTERVTYFRIGGIALVVYGVIQILWPFGKK